MYLDSSLARDDDAQPGWRPETLLAGCENDVDPPVIKTNLLASHGAYTIHYDLRILASSDTRRN